MNKRDKKLQEILDWSKGNDDVRVVMLTSSLANPSAPVDDFSDLDIELVFEDIDFYQSTSDWIGISESRLQWWKKMKHSLTTNMP